MDSSGHQLHIFVFPYMAHGHMIPTVDLAKLFALRGLKATIITTPLNAPLISKTIRRTKGLGVDIDIRTLKFPSVEAGLPEGCENVDSITSHDNGSFELIFRFNKATTMLQEPLEMLLQECQPDCLVADLLFPWATDAAAKFGIPRLVFKGTCFFSLCTLECIRLYEPQKKVSSDSEPFVLTNVPGEIKLTRKQLPDGLRQDFDTDYSKLMSEIVESELKSFGIVVNSFYEVEPAYVDYYRKVLGRRAWPIGPVSLCNRGIEDKAQRGNEASISENECLKWLDSKKPNSVIYICFGSMVNFNASQLIEIARALEASKQEFIWVVRRDKKNQEDEEDWLPKGFEERMGDRTHNKRLGSTRKPMVTWPVFADHFYNEKLVSEVLQIGIGVGVKEWVAVHGEHVKSEAIETAITEVMVSGQAEEMRRRARKLGEMARKAVEEGGSTYSNLNDLVEELRTPRHRP
ncbi:hypothetical protein GH714_015861 [Hevea brasiliensis]|uniref:Glycosyltransferase n=1 Tax=Hevea brasiliensis TaxID=3981 RepID=A0A6A6L0A8_HEVBR|nr:hypothetical protein GH714_015861 [Hevea brasiliensis]